MNKIRNQKGFAVFELILIVVILLGLGGIGWYVMDSNKKTNDRLDNLAKTSDTATKAPAANNKFVFKELGVQIILPESLQGLVYISSPSSQVDGDTGGNVSTQKFTDLVNTCVDSSVTAEPFASVSRSNGTYSNKGILLKQFNGFYIYYAGPSSIICSDSAKEASVESTAKTLQSALVDAFKTATLVQ